MTTQPDRLRVGAHVYLDDKPVTVVAQRYGHVWYTPGHVVYGQMPFEELAEASCRMERPAVSGE